MTACSNLCLGGAYTFLEVIETEMIIAIDEVGDFAYYSQRNNFLVAALLSRSQDGIATKKAQFEAWKSTIDQSKFTKQSEVKGTALSDAELLSFTNSVILAHPIVRNIQIRVIPSENPKDVVLKFKEIELTLIKLVESHFQNLNDDAGVRFFQKLGRWLRDRNFNHYLKMAMLQSCIGRSIQMAIGVSLVDFYINGDDTNLMNLEIKIDKDFVNKDGEKKFFKELLRQSFRSITQTHPVPMTAEMANSTHPFAVNYILPNGEINLGQVFNNRCDFYDSHNHFELQIADILGTILHRAQNKNQALDSAKLLDDILGGKAQMKVHYIANPNPDEEVNLVFGE